MRVHPLAPVVGLDVDGTLADYYEHFRWFAQLYLQKPVSIKWEFADHAEFSEALGLGKNEYRDIKLAYRQGGMKRSIPVLGDAVGLHMSIQRLRRNGVQVWITTTRPWQRLDNIDPDTRFWLGRNVGEVDGVIYGEEKYLDLIDIVGRERILGIVDDLPENVVSALDLGIDAVLRDGGHNKQFQQARPDVKVAAQFSDIYHQVLAWKKEHDAS